MAMVLEMGNHRTSWRIERYASDSDARRGVRYSRLQAARLFGGARQVTHWSGRPLQGIREGLTSAVLLLLLARFREAGRTIKTTARAAWYDIRHFRAGNVLLNAGITVALNLIGGITATAYSNANAYIGVGDSTTAAAASQTNLSAATNKKYNGMAATYPQVSAQTITFQSVFASADANYAWNEFVVGNGNTGVTALNRVVSAQGTKASGQTWTVSVAITLS